MTASRKESALRRTGVIADLVVFFVTGCRWAIAVSVPLFLVSGDRPSALVAAAALLLTFLPARLLGTSLNGGAAAALAAALLAAHVVFGMLFGLYESSTRYDKVMHLGGSGAVAALLVAMTWEYLGRRFVVLPAIFVSVVAFAGTLTNGALWEIFEFAIDQTGLFTAQRSLSDTMIDLLADALGALIALAAYAAADSLRSL